MLRLHLLHLGFDLRMAWALPPYNHCHHLYQQQQGKVLMMSMHKIGQVTSIHEQEQLKEQVSNNRDFIGTGKVRSSLTTESVYLIINNRNQDRSHQQ